MLQESMFSSSSHIICYFAELCHCIHYLTYEESKVRKYGSLQHWLLHLEALLYQFQILYLTLRKRVEK